MMPGARPAKKSGVLGLRPTCAVGINETVKHAF